MKIVILLTTLVMDIVTATALGVLTTYLTRSVAPWWLSMAAGMGVTYWLIMFFFAIVPSVQKSAGSNGLTAAAMMRNLRNGGDEEPGDLRSGRKYAKARKMGFAPNDEPTMAEEPPQAKCKNCKGLGRPDPEAPELCQVCRGTGRKSTIGRV